MILKLIVILFCSWCYWAGGNFQHNFRRFLMPVVLTATVIFITHSFLALTMLFSVGTLCLGYGDNSPIRHIFNNFWGRSIWMFFVSLALSLGLFLTSHLYLYFFIPYVIICFFSGGLLKDWNQLIGDIIYGFLLSSIVLFVH